MSELWFRIWSPKQSWEYDFRVYHGTIHIEHYGDVITIDSAGDPFLDAALVLDILNVHDRDGMRVMHMFATDDLAYEARAFSERMHVEFMDWVLKDRAPQTIEIIGWIQEQLEDMASSMPEIANVSDFLNYAAYLKEILDFLENYKTYSSSKLFYEVNRIYNLGEKVI